MLEADDPDAQVHPVGRAGGAQRQLGHRCVTGPLVGEGLHALDRVDDHHGAEDRPGSPAHARDAALHPELRLGHPAAGVPSEPGLSDDVAPEVFDDGCQPVDLHVDRSALGLGQALRRLPQLAEELLPEPVQEDLLVRRHVLRVDVPSRGVVLLVGAAQALPALGGHPLECVRDPAGRLERERLQGDGAADAPALEVAASLRGQPGLDPLHLVEVPVDLLDGTALRSDLNCSICASLTAEPRRASAAAPHGGRRARS